MQYKLCIGRWKGRGEEKEKERNRFWHLIRSAVLIFCNFSFGTNQQNNQIITQNSLSPKRASSKASHRRAHTQTYTYTHTHQQTGFSVGKYKRRKKLRSHQRAFNNHTIPISDKIRIPEQVTKLMSFLSWRAAAQLMRAHAHPPFCNAWHPARAGEGETKGHWLKKKGSLEAVALPTQWGSLF